MIHLCLCCFWSAQSKLLSCYMAHILKQHWHVKTLYNHTVLCTCVIYQSICQLILYCLFRKDVKALQMPQIRFTNMIPRTKKISHICLCYWKLFLRQISFAGDLGSGCGQAGWREALLGTPGRRHASRITIEPKLKWSNFLFGSGEWPPTIL